MAGSDLVQSLLRGLDILDLIAQFPEGLTVKELAGRMGLRPSTAHNLVRTLAAREYLQKVSHPTRYRLGSALVELTRRRVSHRLHARAAEVLVGLFEKLPCATLVFCESLGGQVVATLRMSPERPGVLERPTGRAVHPYGAASSLVFQAYWPAEQREEFRRAHPFWEHGAHLWKDADSLERFLAGVRQTGHAAPPCGDGIYRVAAPVFSPAGELLAALGGSIHDPAGAGPDACRLTMELVTAAAEKLSASG
ncbi:MAG TPA: transcriptional regulator [Phycisphaerales bacterium]|nr:transcriptional regulator [Phycisphaerales bacterium]